jgi:hypothetical protein
VGYNFLVDKYGTLFEGRFGGVDRAVIGAHTGGFNTSTVGVSMIGNHDLVVPSEATLDTVRRVFAWKLGHYGLDPTAMTTYVSAGGSATFHPKGAAVTVPVISGHRDYSRKSCPGDYAYPLLPSLRRAVADRITASLGATPPPAPPPVTVPGGPTDPAVPPAPEPVTAPTATRLSFASSPSSIKHGAVTTLSGRLTTAAGAPLAGRAVRISFRTRGTIRWALLSTRTTSATGSFSGTHRAVSSLDYTVTWPGDATYAAATRTGRVDVAPVVTAVLSAPVVRPGGRLVLRGTVTPAHAGQRVQRQQYVGRRWVTLATATLDARGAYTFPVTTASKGTKSYRVVKPADTDHLVGVSPTVVLTVR